MFMLGPLQRGMRNATLIMYAGCGWCGHYYVADAFSLSGCCASNDDSLSSKFGVERDCSGGAEESGPCGGRMGGEHTDLQLCFSCRARKEVFEVWTYCGVRV
jgi:hypothetical protein